MGGSCLWVAHICRWPLFVGGPYLLVAPICGWPIFMGGSCLWVAPICGWPLFVWAWYECITCTMVNPALVKYGLYNICTAVIVVVIVVVASWLTLWSIYYMYCNNS